jgi:hypothetical protein
MININFDMFYSVFESLKKLVETRWFQNIYIYIFFVDEFDISCIPVNFFFF